MEKINWMNKNITWGAYLKVAIIMSIIGGIYGLVYYAIVAERNTYNKVKKLFKHKKSAKV